MIVMVRHQLRTNRLSLIAMTVLMAVFSSATLQAYVTAFPTKATRTAVLTPLANNGALRVLYGYPFDIGDPAGWVAWRAMLNVGLIVAMWAAIVTSGALRGEEEAGRGELVLSRAQPRRRWLAAALAATTIETMIIGLGMTLALTAVGVPQHLLTFANSVELALQLVLPALLFGAIAAAASQLFTTVRMTRLAVAGVLVVAFMIRAAADVGNGLGWLRWLSPLGWSEELHPPSHPSPIVLAAFAASIAVSVLVSLPMLRARDVGLGLLPARDSRPPRLFLLRTAWQAALRDETPQLATWLLGTAAYAGLIGGLLKTMQDLMRRIPVAHQMFGDHVAVDGMVAAMFSLFQLLASLLIVTLVVGARGEEATGRLDLLLAMPRSRTGWMGGRLVLAAAAATTLMLTAAVAMWTGAAMSGRRIAFGSLLEATANSAPLVLIVLAAAALVLGLAPRAIGFVYALVATAYLWDALGSVLKAPEWTLQLSPFHALARVPLERFSLTPAAILTLTSVALFAIALWAFRHRDLATG